MSLHRKLCRGRLLFALIWNLQSQFKLVEINIEFHAELVAGVYMCVQSKPILCRKSSRQILCAIVSVLKCIKENTDVSVAFNELENAIE